MSRDNGLWDDDVLVVSTETRGGIAGRIFFAMFMGGLLAYLSFLLVHVPPGPRPPDPWAPISFLIVFDIFAMAAAVGVMVLVARGTWSIDLEGVTHRPCHGRPRRIHWSEVERVRWSPPLKLRGNGKSINLWLHLLDRKEKDAAQERIRKILSSDFDLEDPLHRPDPGPPITVRSALRLLAIGFLATVPGMAGAIALAAYRPEWKTAQATLAFIPFIIMYFCISKLPIRSNREIREIRRIHPAWPWRLRRTKAKLAMDEWREMSYP